jgi:hypothetical protein
MMDPLARHASEIALRLAALPAEGLRDDMGALDSIEQLALQILKEVSAAKARRSRTPGDSRGAWPAMRPLER